MSEPWTVADAQTALEIAFELLAIQERLVTINRGLPVPVNLDAMLSGYIAPDLSTEVSGRSRALARP